MSTKSASIAPIEPARAWEVVLQHIEGDLLSGALKPGDHLPPERALAAELGVGRSSVREAIRVLEVLGLIRTASGSGPQSGAIIVARPTGGMSALVRLQVAAHGFAVRDVVKTRLVLESAVVAELAEARHPDLGAALELLDAMEQDEPLTRDEYLTLDQAFHLALAVASGNEVIASMMAGLRDSIESYVRVGAGNLPSWPDTEERLKAEHRGIVAAIEAHDADLARTRIRQHIETYHAETKVSSIHPD
ncbi:FadR/GntR family transcriptional regulator [Herbiconiux ginsengi]|uniref:DNA-binding transcriptional regulator, FadR family n=1 Tax=Herbiconiux ginsengi TaxID=381665 RepID=A0A1H3LY86_9MICO|nr:FCD domain-containing protein [Herbiconiux ginsengi]SDY69497.1 DNA-binding transcriptional regulator, FadR family [Herbiconiux ginsengi]